MKPAPSRLQQAIDNYAAAYADYEKMIIESDKSAAILDEEPCYKGLPDHKQVALVAALRAGFHVVHYDDGTKHFQSAIDAYRIAYSLYKKAQTKSETEYRDLQTQMRYSNLTAEKSEALIEALQSGFRVQVDSVEATAE